YLDGSVGKAGENKRSEHQEWDLDGNGSLDFNEFKKRGNKQPDQDQLKRDFARRDKDSDGRVTYEEFLGDRAGEQKTEARSAFFRFDANEDGAISEEEFVKRDVKQLSAGNQFRQLDGNDDKQLSEDEFMRPKLGSQWEQSGRDNFQKFDLNGDQKLNEREFAITPALKPDPETMFRRLDVDESGELSRDEFLAPTKENQHRGTSREFCLRDRNEDNRLDMAEYTVDVDELADKSIDPFKLLDVDGDGALAFEEFDARKRPAADDEVANQRYETLTMKREERFLAADQDGDGRLTGEEFATVDAVMSAGDEELAESQATTHCPPTPLALS
ncbi:MAG: EF-hand domain-containing protein, partial [Planctomycetales bacterium]|nr:EF-hand domain-containing protein [Planctomycetales bacterium]